MRVSEAMPPHLQSITGLWSCAPNILIEFVDRNRSEYLKKESFRRPDRYP
ncbi:hypothetical protein SAMN06265222_11035 [Neorhodopirellula lusitana]|uniref:Uncharacterized protein n=1 Tax=Neorhodopirellula lusitana TaxID=445327 RepID=A0ABY1QFA4_9BACT|nr:hypothetical protein SAMN06265222_11035 [Neorhodopirellula lusitana]